MELITDRYGHDRLQIYLTRVLATDVREMLEQAGLSGRQLQDAVEAVTFGVATIIDGSRLMEHEDKAVVPVLTFGVLDETDEDPRVVGLITSGEASSMSEYATGVVAELFGG